MDKFIAKLGLNTPPLAALNAELINKTPLLAAGIFINTTIKQAVFKIFWLIKSEQLPSIEIQLQTI